jgi:hypothetical protein
MLILLTTQNVVKGSAIAHLRSTDRRVESALSTLTAVAEDESGSETTASDRAAFLKLTPAERHRLLAAVIVLDGATAPAEIRDELRKRLAPTNEARFLDSMIDSVEGWWWSRIPTALQTGLPIDSEELAAAIDEARRMHSDRSLPIFPLSGFEEEDVPEDDVETARFMSRLIEINAAETRRAFAAEDYLLAGAHRSRWTRRGLLGVGEISNYENDLSREWLIRSEAALREASGVAEDNERARIGHDLWDLLETSVLPPLRRETTAPFVQRGSIHRLAEDGKVAWHPDSVATIHELLVSDS